MRNAVAARAAAMRTEEAGPVAAGGKLGKASTGERDLRASKAYAAALKLANDWATALAKGAWWIAPDAMVRDVRSPAERAVDKQRQDDSIAAQAAQGRAFAAGLADGPSGKRPAKGGGSGSLNPGQVAKAQRAAGEETAAERKNGSKPTPAGKPGKNGNGIE